ncbi:MAG: GNAT family N-acetyltransferase [Bdellovibrio sp.]
MKINLMSETEYNIWLHRSRASYAADKMKANGFTQEEAEQIARDDFNRLLPDGYNSKDNFLYSAKDEKENILGFIWFCIRGAEGNKRAFICDVVIEEQYRGKGYGKQMMLLMEQEAKKKGSNRIGLHVFGFNETAIRLYQSLGYATTDLVMEKNLSI